MIQTKTYLAAFICAVQVISTWVLLLVGTSDISQKFAAKLMDGFMWTFIANAIPCLLSFSYLSRRYSAYRATHPSIPSVGKFKFILFSSIIMPLFIARYLLPAK